MELTAQRLGPTFSGGLEETYTDFDGWLTRRNWLHRHRHYQRTGKEINPIRKVPTALIDLQDSIVYGLNKRNNNYSKQPAKDIIGLTHFSRQSEDGTQLDLVLLRNLSENGRRRLLLVNRSKL